MEFYLCLWSSIYVYGVLSLSMGFYLCLWSSIFVYGVLSLYMEFYLCLRSSIFPPKPKPSRPGPGPCRCRREGKRNRQPNRQFHSIYLIARGSPRGLHFYVFGDGKNISRGEGLRCTMPTIQILSVFIPQCTNITDKLAHSCHRSYFDDFNQEL